MMDALRRGAQGWVAKILFFILIASFAVWGIADVFTGFNRGSLAKVGGTSITANDFQQAFQQELNQISQQAGRRITPEQGRQFGLDTRALTRLVGGAAIEGHAREMSLALPDAAIVADIEAEKSFQGLDGKFSRQAFDGFLRQIGMSERAFFAAKRKDELREQIVGALTSSIVVPQPMIETLHRHNDEARVIEHLTIDPDKAVKIAEPDEAKLKETYEANKARFMTPEYRKLVVLMLSVDAMKSRMTITDDELKAAFEKDRDTYSRAERRRVEQIAFKDTAAAEAARGRIKSGQSFADAAKETGAKESDIALGLVTKKDLIDPAIADAAFKLEKDKVSDVVAGRFATVLLRVTEIQAGKEATLDEVKDRVKDKIGREKARAEASKLHDGVDDNRAAGKSLKDISTALGIPLIEVAAGDRANKTPEGKAAVEGPDGEKIMRAGFDAQIGIERDPVELADGGYAWVDLVSNTAAAQKPFEAVKDEVKALYTELERKKALSELGAKLVDRVKSGTPLAAIALETGGKVESTLPVTRSVIPQGLTQAAVTQAFVLAKGAAGTTDTADGKSRILFRVADVRPAPPATKEQRETLTGELKSQLTGDIMSSYVAALQDRLGVTINQAELRRITGADSGR
jgi:peptidyl-prolyl cis-trans isomerase D